MKILDLPISAKYERVIPKNAFDEYTNTKQKTLFKDQVLRITWLYKLSKDTINLGYNAIDELHVFVVELKEWTTIKPILEIIDKAIPYHIIFVVRYDNESYVSTSAKHIQKSDTDMAVIDHTFTSGWYSDDELPYSINLQESIDSSYKDFCSQLCDRQISPDKSLSDLVAEEIEIRKIKNEIKLLKSKVKKCKQFNKKVELNMQLKKVEKGLEKYYRVKEI